MPGRGAQLGNLFPFGPFLGSLLPDNQQEWFTQGTESYVCDLAQA